MAQHDPSDNKTDDSDDALEADDESEPGQLVVESEG